MKHKIGVLLVQSNFYPQLGFDYVNGLRLGLSTLDIDNELIIEGIGFGSKSDIIINQAQKLIIQNQVNILTGILGSVGIPELGQLTEGTNTTLLYSDMGAMPPNELINQNVYCNSYNIWNSAQAWASSLKTGENKILNASSYYDGGYAIIEAVEKALYENGGEFVGNYIKPFQSAPSPSKSFTACIQDMKPDTTHAVFSGDEACEFLDMIQEADIKNRETIVGTPFFTDEKILLTHGQKAEGILSYASWSDQLLTESNKKFVEAYTEQHNKIPSVFSMLGFENGLMLGEKLSKTDNNEPLTFIEIEGPRGKIWFDENTNQTIAPAYLREVKRINSEYKNKIIKELNSSTLKNKGHKEYTERGGWVNPYLCV